MVDHKGLIPYGWKIKSLPNSLAFPSRVGLQDRKRTGGINTVLYNRLTGGTALAFICDRLAMQHFENIPLSTGVTLEVLLGGPSGAAAPIMFLHGFPESARTWRHQIAVFSRRHSIAAPHLRGYGNSDKPILIEDYKPAEIVGDIMALADAREWSRFLLVAHDWGGAIGWATALAHPERLAGLVIANSPHPYIFQKSVIEDVEQRAASQYINGFRDAGMERAITDMGIEAWFDMLFGDWLAAGKITEEERGSYLADWSRRGTVTGMLNWYRASPVFIPATGEDAPELPWLNRPFPKITIPVQVLWGMKDKALLPIQLEGLNDYVPDLRINRIEEAGHFSPWEAPEPVTEAITAFIEEIGWTR